MEYTLNNVKNVSEYKDLRIDIGCSDIAALAMVGISPEERPASPIDAKVLYFGGDDIYHAYLVNKSIEIPDHYHFEHEFKTWLKIYDDDSLVAVFEAPCIKVYRAGDYGCLIQLSEKE